MDPMKEALRRKMMDMKAGPQMQAAGDDQKQGTDLAPKLGDDMGGDDEMAEGEVPAIDPDVLRQIIEALSDHDSGSGRAPQGLQEHAAVGARQKLAAMQAKGMKK